MAQSTTTDRIEKRITLKASQERVWLALTDAKQFGDWFGVEFEGRFAAGKHMKGKIKPTVADSEVAKAQEKYAGMEFDFVVDKIDPMRLFSYRWHPFAIDAETDYSKEPMTLVTFTLEAVEGGTALTVTETGFDALPIGRKTDAYEANEEGWGMQAILIEKYLQLKQR